MCTFSPLILLCTGYRTAEISLTHEEVVVFLNDEEERWDGQWPESEPPKGIALFPVHFFQRWLSVDFHESNFCRPLANSLVAQRATLSMTLPHLSALALPVNEVERDHKMLTIYRALQLFSRLSYSYQRWCKNSGNPADCRTFVLEALRLSPGNYDDARLFAPTEKSGVQLDSVFPSRRGFLSRRGRGGSSFSNNNSRTPRAFENRHSSKFQSRNNQRPPQSQIVCFSCGKKGHTARACRSNPQKQNRPTNQNKPNNGNFHNTKGKN